MTGKQLLELLQNTTTFTTYNGKIVEATLENYTFYLDDNYTSLEKIEECQNISINSIDIYSRTLRLITNDEQPSDKNQVTIEQLLESMRNMTIYYELYANNTIRSDKISIEITVKTSRGNEKIYWFGTNMNVPGKKKPYGWNRVKDLIVEEITEINSSKKFVLRITAREQ